MKWPLGGTQHRKPNLRPKYESRKYIDIHIYVKCGDQNVLNVSKNIFKYEAENGHLGDTQHRQPRQKYEQRKYIDIGM